MTKGRKASKDPENNRQRQNLSLADRDYREFVRLAGPKHNRLIEQDVKCHLGVFKGPVALKAFIADLDLQEELLRDQRERALKELARQEEQLRRAEHRMEDAGFVERIQRVAADVGLHPEKMETLSDRARVIAMDYDLPAGMVEEDIRRILT